MPISTITSKGQTTVPKEVRDVLNVGIGDKLTWEGHEECDNGPNNNDTLYGGCTTCRGAICW